MSSNGGKRLIVIVGPTAVGKTDLSIKLAERLQTEIISADARQVYKEMMIGTARPTEEQLSRVPHHFIASHSVHESYDAATFGEEALGVIRELFSKHDRVVMCGGSGLYVKAVLEGFDDAPEIPEGVREKIIALYKENGLSWLQDRVREQDPEYFQIVDQKNPHRLMRALEIVTATGRKMHEWRRNSKRQLDFEVVKIGLTLPAEVLYDRIDRRMDQMIAEGLFQEAESLYELRTLQALQTVGYREIFDFLNGAYDREEAIRLLKRNTRHYAKRQMTWFKKGQEIKWFEPNQWNEIVNVVEQA